MPGRSDRTSQQNHFLLYSPGVHYTYIERSPSSLLHREMTTLTHLPTEVLGRIAKLAEGFCVLRLALLSGASTLGQKLFIGTTELYFLEQKSKNLANWPTGVQNFARLSSLVMAYDQPIWVQGIDSQCLTTLPKSIRHVTFRFENAVSCWLVRKVRTLSPASSALPSPTISASHTSSALPSLILLNQALPHLETLTLISTRRDARRREPLEDAGLAWSPQLFYHFVSNLPARLRRFECDPGMLTRRKILDALPPLLSGISATCLQEPCDISELTLESNYVDSFVDDTTTLELGQICITPTVPLLGLTIMRLPSVVVQDVSTLPRSLTVLTVHSIVQANAAKFLPPNLDLLKVRSECIFTTLLKFEDIPRSIRKLSIASLSTRANFSGLPSGLLSFRLRMFTFYSSDPIDWLTLPRGLASLKLKLPLLLSRLEPAQLPPKLEKLFVHADNHSLAYEDVLQLPNTLQELGVDFNFNLGAEEICALGAQFPRLTKLFATTSLISDLDLVYLPKKLVLFQPKHIVWTGAILPPNPNTFSPHEVCACVRSHLPAIVAKNSKLEISPFHRGQRESYKDYIDGAPRIVIQMQAGLKFAKTIERWSTYNEDSENGITTFVFPGDEEGDWIEVRKHLKSFESLNSRPVVASQFNPLKLELLGAVMDSATLLNFKEGGFTMLKSMTLQTLPGDFSALPRTLTSLTLLDDKTLRTQQAPLPEGMQTLRMPKTKLFQSALRSCLVPSLTELWVARLKLDDPIELLEALPPQLKAFDACRALASFVSKRSPNLVLQVGIHVIPPCSFWSNVSQEEGKVDSSWFEENVTSIGAPLCENHLDVSSCLGSASKSLDRGASIYPASSKNFRTHALAMSCTWNSVSFETLPRSVLDVTLLIKDPLLPSSLSSLPSTLTRLHLVSFASVRPTPPGNPEIPKFLPRSLTDLWISAHQWRVPSYTALPRGLLTLGLTGAHKKWSQKKCSALPPRLTDLTLFCPNLSDSHLQGLPPTLKQLVLPESHQLTQHCIPHLPGTLDLLSLPSQALDLIVPSLSSSVRVIYQNSSISPQARLVRA